MAKNQTREKLKKANTLDKIREYIAEEIKTSEERLILFYSGRGIGKTYTTQKTILADALREGFEVGFIVLKDKEIKGGALSAWLEKVLRNEFSNDYDFKIDKNNGYYSEKGAKDFRRFITIFAIANADEYKVKSFPNMRYLIWDECVKARQRPEDEKAIYNFLSIYETIDRNENKLKAICLCNVLKTAKTSPVFCFFKVPVETLPRDIHIDGTRKAIYLPIFDTEKSFAEGEEQYKGMSEGHFERYHYGNLIQKPDETETANAGLIIEQNQNYYFGIMQTDKNIYIEYLEKLTDTTKELFRVYTLHETDVESGKPLCPPKLKQILLNAYITGHLKFINEETLLRSRSLQKFIYGAPFLTE